MKIGTKWSEPWYGAFQRWAREAFGQQWTDKAVDRDHVESMKKGFRAGWRAAVRHAQQRVVDRAKNGDAQAKELALRLRCEHCGKSPVDDLPDTPLKRASAWQHVHGEWERRAVGTGQRVARVYLERATGYWWYEIFLPGDGRKSGTVAPHCASFQRAEIDDLLRRAGWGLDD